MAGSDPSGGYVERLWPSPAMWLLVPLAALSGALMVGPYGVAVWATCALVAGVLATAGLVVASARVSVRDGKLTAGRAEIPTHFLGETSWARGQDASAERGTRLDARAFLMIRGWVDPVLKVSIEDADDPTPYWLISTRHPERLAQAIEAARP